MGKTLSGAEKIEFDVAGNAFAAPTTILKKNLHSDTNLEVEENEDDTDPDGNSPHSGQTAVVTIASWDFGARATLVGYRTAASEDLIDVKFYFPNGDGTYNTVTVLGIRAKTSLDTKPGESGRVNVWMLESRGFTTGVVDFD